MNIIWLILCVASIVLICITCPDMGLNALMSGAQSGVSLLFTLLPVYVVWAGITEILLRSGLGEKISRLMLPILKRLFPNCSNEAYDYIALNFTFNIIGLGSASTPMGIEAIRLLDNGEDTANHNQRLFTVINTSSLSLVPTTMISLLSVAGASNPSSIILPTLLVSTICTIVGIVLCKVLP